MQLSVYFWWHKTPLHKTHANQKKKRGHFKSAESRQSVRNNRELSPEISEKQDKVKRQTDNVKVDSGGERTK